MQESSPVGQWSRDWQHLPALTDKQRFVLSLRYGLKDGCCYSFEEIAEWMGISKQGVKRIEKRGMRALRKGLGVDE